MAIKNTNHAFFLKAQFPLDIKQVYNTRQDLIDAMSNASVANTFYKGLTVFINEDNTVWRWQEYDGDENKTWLTETPYTYPNCWKTDTVDYSSKQYNFVRLYMEELYYQGQNNPAVATYLLVFDTIQDLKDYKSNPINGETAIVKETQNIYKFDSTNTDADNGITVIVPTGGDATGRWLKYEDYARKDVSNVDPQDAINQFGGVFFRVDQNNSPQDIINGKPTLQETILDTDDSKVFVNKEYVDTKDNDIKTNYLPANYAQLDLNNVSDTDLVNRLNTVVPQPLNINVQQLGGRDYTEYSVQYNLYVDSSWDVIDWHRIVKIDWNANVGAMYELSLVADEGAHSLTLAFSYNSGTDTMRLVSNNLGSPGLIIISNIRLVKVGTEYYLDIKGGTTSTTIPYASFTLRNINGDSILTDKATFLTANPTYDTLIQEIQL